MDVRDLREARYTRTRQSPAEPSSGAVNTAEKPQTEAARSNTGQANIVVEQGSSGGQAGGQSPANAQSQAPSSPQALQAELQAQLRTNLSGDIVRQAQMILRSGGSGQTEGAIRLTLKPETLGNVKIRLEMAENKITGHITVESDDALKAFEREIHSLEQAFRDAGFEGVTLDMTLASGGGAEGGQQAEEDASRFSPWFAASRYDESAETVQSGGWQYATAETGVNLLV
jgi:flagellar hook-length control protein FliK